VTAPGAPGAPTPEAPGPGARVPGAPVPGAPVRAGAGAATGPAPLPAGWWGLGIDVGGTKTAAAVVDASGALLHPVVRATPAAQGSRAILDTMAEAAAEALRLAGRAAPEAVGVSTGGVVDHARGTVVSSTDLLAGWSGTPVAAELSARLGGTPVRVDNDGNALALGEWYFGAARGLDDVLFTAVGTGIAGALVRAGRLARGAHHAAGELGHLPAHGAGDERCSCGRRGHLEAVAAGPALAARFARRTAPPDPGSHREGAPVDLRAVAALAAGGDPAACEVLRFGATVLGRTLGGLANVLDPQAVVVGGGVPGSGPLYWAALEAAFRAELLPTVTAVALRPAQAGPLAAIAGAAVLARTP
jgi:glucokinase